MSDLKDAVSYLGAVEVAPSRYAFKVGAQWRVCGDPTRPHFRATMPAWWTPQRPFLVKHRDGATYHGTVALAATFDSLGAALLGLEVVRDDGWSVVTADLETGAEIAA